MKDDTPFILECPGCHTRYEIPVSIPEGGRKVRCANCTHIWIARPEDTFRMGEEPPFLASVDVAFREGGAAADASAQAADDGDAARPDPVAQAEPARSDAAPSDAMPEAALSEAAISEAAPSEATSSDPQAFAAALARAEARAERTGEFTAPEPNEADAEAAAKDDGDGLAPGAAADAAFGEAESSPDPHDPPQTRPDASGDGDRDGGSEAADDGETDEVEAFYGDPMAASPGRAGRRAARSTSRRPAARAKNLRVGVVAGWAMLLFAVGLAGFLAVNQRVAIVRLIPGSASLFEAAGFPVNIRGLDFRDVAYSWETDGGQAVLEVHGDILNLTARPLDVPMLVLGLRDATGVEVYRWEEEVMTTPLDAGESATFAVQIPMPPQSIKSVQVRFAKGG